MTRDKDPSTAELDHDAIRHDFAKAVNMSPAELGKWLKTEDSKSIGWTREGEHEAIGHQSGRKIVAVKQKNTSELTSADYEHMRKVVGYVHRHLAQGGPAKDEEHSRWRYSLMNWGHDPNKK